MKDAVDIGYRHFDCAFVYGNEAEVGQGIKAKIVEGVVTRYFFRILLLFTGHKHRCRRIKYFTNQLYLFGTQKNLN